MGAHITWGRRDPVLDKLSSYVQAPFGPGVGFGRGLLCGAALIQTLALTPWLWLGCPSSEPGFQPLFSEVTVSASHPVGWTPRGS